MKQFLDRLTHKWLRIPYTLQSYQYGVATRSGLTVVMLHGIGNSSKTWDEVIERLPKNTAVITLDLLGFGKSPRPDWAAYSARTQARSVAATLLKIGVRGKVILVGHSLGGLVAIEIANRYRFAVKGVVLCSPPLYKPSDSDKQQGLSPDATLRRLYRQVGKHPKLFTKVSRLAIKYKLANNSFNVDETNVASYVSTLETAIINQSSLADCKKLTIPTTIIHGRFDPLVITANLKAAVAANSKTSLVHINAGHDLNDVYEDTIIKVIRQIQTGEDVV